MLKHLVSDLQHEKQTSTGLTDKKTKQRILNSLFTEQKQFILDKAPWKSLRCPRRAGKSHSALASMVVTALERPGALIKYICLTRGQAKANLWGPLKKFSDTYELGLTYHETDLRSTFPNSSVISFAGAETRKEIEKLRGQSYDLVIIDEGKSFQSEILHDLIYDIVDATLADRFGTLIMMGTPGNVLAGPFFEATSSYNPETQIERRNDKPCPFHEKAKFKKNGWKWNWSFHNWHTKQNVKMPHIWERALASKNNRDIPDNDPTWLREWMGEWCPSDSLMVYEFSSSLNVYDGTLPSPHEWNFLLGLDLGFHDSTAIVVVAYSETHPKLFQVYEWKEPHQLVHQIESKVHSVRKMFNIDVMVADTGGLGKTIIETLRDRGLSFIPAVKTNKLDHISMVNSDMRLGRIMLLPDSMLGAEMKLLQWKDKRYKAEDKATDNHLCDAFIYIVRYAYHHFWQPVEKIIINEQERLIAEFEAEELRIALLEENTERDIVDLRQFTNRDGVSIWKL